MFELLGKTGLGGSLRNTMLALAAVAMWALIDVAAAAPPAGRRVYNSAQDAAAALVTALKDHDTAALNAIFGTKSMRPLTSGDAVADRNDVATFLQDYGQMHRFANGPDGKYYLLVGAKNWPMPIPLATSGSKWYFDTSYGERELRYRRIGRNELDAIGVCREVVGAQNEYYNQTHDGQTHQYASELMSDAGKQDGLYWKAAADQPPSPIGPLIATASEEGYRAAGKDRPQEYYGYLYKLLTAQGASAPGGAKDYMQGGRMTGGFAILAYPVKYADSGVMTFMAGSNGQIYEKDLGAQTESIASRIKQFDPDKSWLEAGSE